MAEPFNIALTASAPPPPKKPFYTFIWEFIMIEFFDSNSDISNNIDNIQQFKCIELDL